MECKAPIPLPFLEGRSAHPLIQVYFEFNHLKQLYRQGWLRRGIDPALCESVAEHSFATAVLALMICDAYFPELDTCQVLRLALLHDFGEVYAGDIVPSQNMPPEEKHRLEREAVEKIFRRMPSGERYLDLWEAYEAGSTPEARFVRQIDRLEMAFQASIYEYQEMGDLQEFYDSALAALSDPKLLEVIESLLNIRVRRFAS